MLETIGQKISDEIQVWIRKQKNFVGHLLKLLGAILLTMAITYPGMMWRALWAILSWNHFFISFFLEFTVAIYYITPILKREIQQIKMNFVIEKDELLFCGASLDKVIDYLMTSGTFKRADIEREFGVNRGTYYEMVEILDRLGIFVRGENNVRRVDVSLSRRDILERLSPTQEEVSDIGDEVKKEDIQALQTGFKRTAIG